MTDLSSNQCPLHFFQARTLWESNIRTNVAIIRLNLVLRSCRLDRPSSGFASTAGFIHFNALNKWMIPLRSFGCTLPHMFRRGIWLKQITGTQIPHHLCYIWCQSGIVTSNLLNYIGGELGRRQAHLDHNCPRKVPIESRQSLVSKQWIHICRRHLAIYKAESHMFEGAILMKKNVSTVEQNNFIYLFIILFIFKTCIQPPFFFQVEVLAGIPLLPVGRCYNKQSCFPFIVTSDHHPRSFSE